MRRFGWTGLLVLFAIPVAVVSAGTPSPGTPPARPAPAQGEPAVEAVSGAYAFRTYCASCHGTQGKGDGPLAENLRFHPADLTLIARRHGGNFPTEMVVRIVDGRDPLKGHGGPDMPVWGDAFRNPDTNFDEKRVREKIRSIVEYVKTLQVK